HQQGGRHHRREEDTHRRQGEGCVKRRRDSTGLANPINRPKIVTAGMKVVQIGQGAHMGWRNDPRGCGGCVRCKPTVESGDLCPVVGCGVFLLVGSWLLLL
ncbi:unnamed protein product, partial [Phaeothamnion confervicola]